MTPIRKRRAATAVTAAVALAAGAVLAATAFSYTQEGSASAGVAYVDTVDEGEISVNDLTLGELPYRADTSTQGDAQFQEDNDPFVATFENTADEDAAITLTDIVRTSEENGFFRTIKVIVETEDGSTVYRGSLRMIGNQALAIGTVPGNGELDLNVWAWTDEEFTTTDEEADDTISATFEITYDVEGTGEFTTPTDPPAEPTCDDVPDELDPDGSLESGHDDNAGDCEQPTQDGFPPAP